jgi:hypothetical protein
MRGRFFASRANASGTFSCVAAEEEQAFEVRGPVRSRWVAVNTADAAESDLRAAESTGSNISILSRNWGALATGALASAGSRSPPRHRMVPPHRRVTE